MEENNIYIKRLVVHILDSNTGVPVLSDMEHSLEEAEINDFICKHVNKVLKDDYIKTARFINEENKVREACGTLFYNENEFVGVTRDLADNLFNIMMKNPDIPSADLVCCLLTIDDKVHLGLLKFNYRPSYIHYVQNSSSGKVNSIIKQKTALPGEGQKVDEAVLIGLQDYSIKLIEKKYDINGEKIFYFSDMFLECSSEVSEKEKAKLFKKATEVFNKKFCQGDVEKAADVRKAITESIDDKEAIDVLGVAESAFRRNPDMRNAYIEHIEKSGIKDRTIAVAPELSEKVFKKHKIKTDTGIEINLPVDYYKDKDKVEFISNPDGTISIVIKNIGSITDC